MTGISYKQPNVILDTNIVIWHVSYIGHDIWGVCLDLYPVPCHLVSI